MRNSLFLLLFISAVFGGSAQTTITLRVINQDNQQGIEQVAVENAQGKVLGWTDVDGKLSLDSLPALILVSHLSYEEQMVSREYLAKNNYELNMVAKVAMLEEVVVSTNKFGDSKREVPHRVSGMTSEQIATESPQTSADLLEATGQVFVQRSQMGGGSPVIRGFEANRVLLVVDGVRMNNAIYRGGHLQNAITIDPNAQERVEVVYGPSSVMYGSDALGGVVHFHTKRPKFSKDSTMLFQGGYMARYSSANNGSTAGVDFNIGLKNVAFYTSVSMSTFGDLRSGKRNNFFNDYRWDRPEYVEGDSVVSNDKPHVQVGTGYQQIDFLQNISFYTSDVIRHDIGFQYSTSSDVPRYDKLQEYRNGSLRWAEWKYGPQKRMLAYYKLDLMKDNKWFSDGRITLSYQDIQESRISRQVGKTGQENQVENVDVLGLSADFLKYIGKKHRLEYGLESYYNIVNSTAYEEDILTGERTSVATRYADGGSTWWSSGAYLTHKLKLGKHTISEGLRLSNVGLTSNFATSPVSADNGLNVIHQNNTALTGSLGLTSAWEKGWTTRLLGSTGFKAPNVDDVGKTFESKSGFLTVPNADLKPEYLTSLEASVQKKWKNKSYIEASLFHSWLRDAIIRAPIQVAGQDSVLVDGKYMHYLANQNTGKATIYGVYVGGRWNISSHFEAKASMTWTKGGDVTNDLPLGHIPPMYGRVGLVHKTKRFQQECYSLFNGAKRAEDFNPDVDKLELASPDGNPAWLTLNYRVSYDIKGWMDIQLAVQNILDTHYRTFSSGVNGAGRNVAVTLRGRF